MSYSPINVYSPDPVFLGTFSSHSLGLNYHGRRSSAPVSGVLATNRVSYIPFYTSRGYSLARWWWNNGATVGTDYLQVGIYTEALDLFKASPRTLSAGTLNILQFTNPGIHSVNLENNDNNADQTSYTTGTVTLKAGVLYTISVINSKASGADAVASITGGPTWTSRSTTQYGATTDARISIWSGVPTIDYTGTLSISFGANTQLGCGWSINAHYHADTATNDGIVQQAVGTGTSVTPLATLAAFGSANNGTFGAFGNTGGNSCAPESASYIELSDNSYGTPNNGLATYFRPDNDTTVSGTIVSAAWGACAVEIKSLGTGPIYIPAMRGYLALHSSGVTATVFRRAADENYRPYVYQQTSGAQTGLPPVAVLAASTGIAPVYGFTSRATP